MSLEEAVFDLRELSDDAVGELAGRVAPVVRAAFGSMTASKESMEGALRRDELLVTLSDAQDRALAFLLASTVEVLTGQDLTWVSRVAVASPLQGRGAGQRMVREAAIWRPNRWIGCATQNPSMAGALGAVCSPPLWPVDEAYTSGDEPRNILNAVRRSIALCSTADDEGVVRSAYGQRLGEFEDGRRSPIHELLCSRHVSQADGDAVVFSGRIRSDLCGLALDAQPRVSSSVAKI